MVEVFRINDIDPSALDAERRRVLALLTAIVPPERVHEVGSTAVPGIVGKQDLDFLVLVQAQDFRSTRHDLDQQFPRNLGQLSNDVYQGYKVDSALDVAIQLTIEGSAHDNFLTFLDALRASANLRAEYNRLKQAFDGRAMDKYRDAKGAFIEKVLSSTNS